MRVCHIRIHTQIHIHTTYTHVYIFIYTYVFTYKYILPTNRLVSDCPLVANVWIPLPLLLIWELVHSKIATMHSDGAHGGEGKLRAIRSPLGSYWWDFFDRSNCVFHFHSYSVSYSSFVFRWYSVPTFLLFFMGAVALYRVCSTGLR